MTHKQLWRLANALSLAVLLAGILLGGTLRSARAAGVVSCSYAMTNEAFGTVDVLPGAAISTSAVLTIACSGLSPADRVFSCVSFPTPRAMSGPSGLSYDLLGPPPQLTSWSSTTPIVLTALVGSSTTVAVNATLFGNQTNAVPGYYSQNLTAVVDYGTTSCTSGQVGTAAFSFMTTATVTKACNVSATSLAFGTVGSFGAPVDAQSQISVQCSNQAPYSIGLNGGLANAADPTQRQMTAGAQTITYGLYLNSARSLPWGSAAGVNVLSGTGNASTQTVPVYGRIPSQAIPSAGTYSDTITISVLY